MTRWTGPDRDHDYFESRADEHRPIGDWEGNGYTPTRRSPGQPELSADDEYLYARERET